MIINTTDLGTLVITQPATDLPAIRISANIGLNGEGMPAGGSEGQVLRKVSSDPFDATWTDERDSQWGYINGTLSSQTDLADALAGKQSIAGMSDYLTVSQAASGYYPVGNPAGYLVYDDLDGYVSQASANALYYPLAGNPAGYLTASSLSGYLTAQTASATYQTLSGMGAYETTSHAASTYYPLSNPNGYITETVLDDFLTTTEASEVYQTQANMVSYVTDAEAVTKLGPYFLPTSGGTMAANALQIFTVDSAGYDSEVGAWGFGVERTSAGEVAYITPNILSIKTNGEGTEISAAGITFPNGSTQAVGFIPSDYLTATQVASGYYPLGSNPAGYITSAALTPYATTSSVTAYAYPLGSNPAGYITSSALTPYAPLAGASFTGKVNISNGTTAAPLNIGSNVTPAASVAGDIWIATTNLAYRDSNGIQRNTVSTNQGNTFTQPQIISQASSATPSLSVTQTGAGGGLLVTNTGNGYSFKVEDATSPDATPFAIDASGRVGIGIAPDATVALTVDSSGMKFNTLTFNPTSVGNAPASPVYAKELLITIGGVNYAIPARLI